jgi:phosphoribosylformimino-5-aminoimidazole carboxamide ribotide isomerase
MVADICGRLPAASAAASARIDRARRCSLGRARGDRQLRAVPRWRGRRRLRASVGDAVGAGRVIAAVDSRGGQVVIHGWKTALPITAVEAVRALETFCAEFLYTHVDTEGLMQGTDMGAILAVRAATSRRVTAAGGITTWDDIDRLDAAGVDAVVGMAIYTGQLKLPR